MKVDELNSMDDAAFRSCMARVCGSQAWIDGMVGARPYASQAEFEAYGLRAWEALGEPEWREAFSYHPRIGDKENLRKRFADTAEWAENEQASMTTASDEVIDELSHLNEVYLDRFGYIFIICATGLSAVEMLAELKSRLQNDPEQEIQVAQRENGKIIRLRLTKL